MFTPYYTSDQVKAQNDNVACVVEAIRVEESHARELPEGSHERLMALFQRYEIPIGLLGGLNQLSECARLLFILDDSGSMEQTTSLTTLKYRSAFMQRLPIVRAYQRRWDEVEDRLHLMLEILLEVKTGGPLEFRFLNHKAESMCIHHDDKHDAESVHAGLHDLFLRVRPSGPTPIFEALALAFHEASFSSTGPHMIYLFTDGCPTDASTFSVRALICERASPRNSPLVLLSCTDHDADVRWMKDVDESAAFVAELDDFETERQEILRAQGPAIPYNHGWWVMCSLIAPLFAEILDKLDEPGKTLSREELSALLGRQVSPSDYAQLYLKQKPPRPRQRLGCSLM